MFPGYMAVVLFGPFKHNIDAGRTIDFFLNADPKTTSIDTKKDFARGASRQQKSDEQAFIRRQDQNRGLSITDKTRVASVQIQHAALKLQHKRGELAHKQDLRTNRLNRTAQQLDALRKRMELEVKVATATGNWEKYKMLEKNYDDMALAYNNKNLQYNDDDDDADLILDDVIQIELPDITGLKRGASPAKTKRQADPVASFSNDAAQQEATQGTDPKGTELAAKEIDHELTPVSKKIRPLSADSNSSGKRKRKQNKPTNP